MSRIKDNLRRDKMISVRLSNEEIQHALEIMGNEGGRSISDILRRSLMMTPSTGIAQRINLLEERVAKLEQSNLKKDYIGDTFPTIRFGSMRDDLDT